ncbi:MAG: MFS transporter [Planctomycetes bacterium]|nr:MFS transporter [Planctomycetota bacterium]
MSHLHHQTAAKDRIPWLQLTAYGMGGIIPIALFNIAGQLMGLIANIGLGLSAFWLGVILIFPRLWDAISDPLMGHISDNTRTRWGRRRPYLLIGGITVAITFVIMWWIPRGDSVEAMFQTKGTYEWFQLGYILFWLLAFYTACTIFEIPHGALGMEMSKDYHERTRLFSAKSFLGNMFAMGTPWLFALANLEIFKGVGGDEVDGMKFVSMLIAVVLIPLAIWWTLMVKEPGFEAAKKQKKTHFWEDMRTTFKNKTFLALVLVIFLVATGFNFVGLLSYYISIFYLYAGNKAAAGPLLGINGTVWAVTGLIAVFPLNWLSRRVGKSNTLLIAILLMAGAQVSKIFCYNITYPYLVIIPTFLLSAGMLFFFTLGSSMVGDVCDEDELKTGKRREGSFYSVFWWFLKMGMAIASLVTGILIVYTQFNETQASTVDNIFGPLNVISAKSTEAIEKPEILTDPNYMSLVNEQLVKAHLAAEELQVHFNERADKFANSKDHYNQLSEQTGTIMGLINTIPTDNIIDINDANALAIQCTSIADETNILSRQTPTALLRLRVVEIGLPILLCLMSIIALRFYPLTEERVYEIKQLLEERKQKKQTQ